MNRFKTLLFLGCLLCLSAFSFKEDPEPAAAEPFERLEGTLLSQPFDELAHPHARMPREGAPFPEVPTYVEDVTRLGLPPGTSRFMVKVVPLSQARYRFSGGGSPHSKGGRRAEASSYASEAKLPEAPIEPEAPTVSLSDSFRFFDRILEEDGSAYALNQRHRRGGITLRLEMIGRWNDLYLLKFSVQNEEERELFISRVTLSAGGSPVVSHLHSPFSCRAHEETHGIVTFPIASVTGQNVDFAFCYGGHNKTLKIKPVDYTF